MLLKRGLSATIKELLMAAEYIVANGNHRVILCERGIRTFETMTRNTLDINAIPVLKALTHLPVVVDPSHGIGLRAHVPAIARAGVAAGADGIMVEVHPCPEKALSDGHAVAHAGGVRGAHEAGAGDRGCDRAAHPMIHGLRASPARVRRAPRCRRMVCTDGRSRTRALPSGRSSGGRNRLDDRPSCLT